MTPEHINLRPTFTNPARRAGTRSGVLIGRFPVSEHEPAWWVVREPGERWNTVLRGRDWERA